MGGIATRLQTISGLRATAYRPDQANPPFAWVELPSQIDYHNAFAHGTMRLDFTVKLAVSKAVDRIDQPALGAYMDITGTKSVHSAIEADRTLGGLPGCDCIVISAKELDFSYGGTGWYGAEFLLHVVASGS